jgi:hypothetical protein
MNDILLGITMLGSLSVCLAWCAGTASRHVKSRWINTTAAVVFIGTLAFSLTIHGRLVLTRILPFSNVIVLGNWIPLGSSFLIGIVLGHRAIPKWRRAAVSVMLASLAWYTVADDLIVAAPNPARPSFHRGVCVQTTPASCSPCCAVTLLMHHGIQSNEQEMMDLCLTRGSGTPELGLYRGLKLKTRGTHLEVRVIHDNLDFLKQPDNCPAIVLVATGKDGEDARRSVRLYRHPNHAIVVYGIGESGMVEVGNPSTGRSRWTVDDLRRRWRRSALSLVPK